MAMECKVVEPLDGNVNRKLTLRSTSVVSNTGRRILGIECKVSFEGLRRLQVHVLDEDVFDLSK